MNVGIIKWFDNEKEFGMILLADGREVFLHINDFSIPVSDSLSFGIVVCLNIATDSIKERLIAADCRIMNEITDWNFVLENFENDIIIDTYVLEKHFSKHGNPYYSKDSRSISLVTYVGNQIFKTLNNSEITNIAVGAFLQDFSLQKLNKYFNTIVSIYDKNIKYYFFDKKKINRRNEFIREAIEKKYHLLNSANSELFFLFWKNFSLNDSYFKSEKWEIPELFFKNHIDKMDIYDLQRIESLSYFEIFRSFFCCQKEKEISSTFINEETNDDKRITILKAVDDITKLELAKKYSLKYTKIATINLLMKYYNERLMFDRINELKIYLADTTDNYALIKDFWQYFLKESSDFEKFELYLFKYLDTYPIDKIHTFSSKLDSSHITSLYYLLKEDTPLFIEILKVIIHDSDFSKLLWIFEFTKEKLAYEDYLYLNNFMIEKINEEQHRHIWENGLTIIHPVTKSIYTILDEYNITYLYHMTHSNNLCSILRQGLLSYEMLDIISQNYVDISNFDVQSRRKHIHTYVPLYFNPKNPMLFVKKEIQDDIIIFAIGRELLLHPGTKFTDGNAASNNTSSYNSINHLAKLDWNCIFGSNWTNHEDGKRIRCAEILYPYFIPISHIKKIIVNNSSAKNKVQQEIGNRQIDIEVNSHFYF